MVRIAYNHKLFEPELALAAHRKDRPTSSVVGWGWTRRGRELEAAVAYQGQNVHLSAGGKQCICGLVVVDDDAENRSSEHEGNENSDPISRVLKAPGHINYSTKSFTRLFIVGRVFSPKGSLVGWTGITDFQWYCQKCGFREPAMRSPDGGWAESSHQG